MRHRSGNLDDRTDYSTRPVGMRRCRLSAKFRTMAGTGLLSDHMMDVFVAKRSADVREATKQTTSQTPPFCCNIFSTYIYGYQKPTGHNPTTEIPAIKKRRWNRETLKFWIGSHNAPVHHFQFLRLSTFVLCARYFQRIISHRTIRALTDS